MGIDEDDDGYPRVGSEAFFRTIVETSANPYVVIDHNLILRYASRSIEMLLGWSASEWVGKSIAELLDPDSLQLAEAGLLEIDFASRDPNWVGAPLRLFLLTKSGKSVPVDVFARESSRTGIGGTLVQLVRADTSQTMGDAVDTILQGHDLDRALSLLTSLVEHDISGTSAILAGGWDGSRFTTIAGRDRLLVLRALDPTDAEAIAGILASGHRVADLFDRLSPTTRDEARRRGYHACWCAPVPTEDGRDPSAALFIWRDESGPPGVVFRDAILGAVSLAELALRWMGHQQVLTWNATHDQLTGLTNRAEFQNRLDDSVGRSRAVLFCDLDDFKPVNEILGHRTGDRVLSVVASRMAAVCPNSVIARVGGDEFAILLEVDSHQGALEVADQVQTMLQDPVAVDGAQAQIGVTIGVAFDPTGRTDGDHLMDHADRLLREGKSLGKGMVRSVTLPAA